MDSKHSVIIIGAGKTGESAAKYFLHRGHKVYIFDDRIERSMDLCERLKIGILSASPLPQTNTLLTIGMEDKIPRGTFAILSPGIRSTYNPHPFVNRLRENGVRIISDVDIMSEILMKEQKVIAITGTNGKSTTTSLLHHVLSKIGFKSILCGNIGIPILDCDFIDCDYICLEASSYQLEISDIAPYCGILLNISPDHLDHHGGMDEYIRCKKKIFKGNTISVCSFDDEICQKISKDNLSITLISTRSRLETGLFSLEGRFFINGEDLGFQTSDLRLLGEHNLQNVLAVLAFCLAEGLDLVRCWEAITSFSGLKHRIEEIRIIGKIRFINDSKATNPDSTVTALKCFNEIYLIAGGISKHSRSIKCIEEFSSKIRKVFLIGQSSNEFNEDLDLSIKREMCWEMREAVSSAYKCAIQDLKNGIVQNPIILLSPLCASMDQYKDFEERGDDFRGLVDSL